MSAPLVPTTVSEVFEAFLRAVADEIEVPESKYEAAERSYSSVGKWLDRPESVLTRYEPRIFAQGSFAIGTATKPMTDKEEYDVDAVCRLLVPTSTLTQQDLKHALGLELEGYARAKGMQRPEEKRRCWTLNYADSAQFHLDCLPAVPDERLARLLLAREGVSPDVAQHALSITDTEHPCYKVLGGEWPGSNPKGYAEWFRGRMIDQLKAKKRAKLGINAEVEKIPDYRVKTTLQDSVKLLKRHRDCAFADQPDDKTASIILTTLAGQAYQQEQTLASSLFGILGRMDRFVEDRGGEAWIANPADPRENFADRWKEKPERKNAFHWWLETAREDFRQAAASRDVEAMARALEVRLGRERVAAATRNLRLGTAPPNLRPMSAIGDKIQRLFRLPHRRIPSWRENLQGRIDIRATWTRDGFRPEPLPHDGPALPKRASIRFEALTEVPRHGCKVYWQVVNSGDEAIAAGGLRGGFDEGRTERGNLTRTETTLYRGFHSIQCFLVRDGACIAKSDSFVVNIA